MPSRYAGVNGLVSAADFADIERRYRTLAEACRVVPLKDPGAVARLALRCAEFITDVEAACGRGWSLAERIKDDLESIMVAASDGVRH